VNKRQACQTLNVSTDAKFEDVKDAYRKLALELHPDRNKSERNDSRFKQITIAYHFLKNNKNGSESNNQQYKSERKYTSTKTKNDYTFKQRKPKWKFDKDSKTPGEDWSRYTKEFEEDKDWWEQYEKKFWKMYDSGVNSFFDDEEEPSNGGKRDSELDLHTEVDPSLCIACCSCETIAPGVFRIDRNTKLNPKSKVHTQNGANAQKIMAAAETCPTKAISVDQVKTGRRLFPY